MQFLNKQTWSEKKLLWHTWCVQINLTSSQFLSDVSHAAFTDITHQKQLTLLSPINTEQLFHSGIFISFYWFLSSCFSFLHTKGAEGQLEAVSISEGCSVTLSLTLRAPAACTVGNKSADEEIIVLFLLCLRILLTFLLTALKGQSDQIFFSITVE